jgi:hypothetical protein
MEDPPRTITMKLDLGHDTFRSFDANVASACFR